MEFEDVLKEVGDYGKYQKFLVLFFLIPTGALNSIYDFLFMMSTPDHWCYVPQLSNLTMEQQSDLIRPWIYKQGLPAKDNCRMYDLNYDDIARTLQLPFNATFNDTDSFKKKECDKWTYDKTIFEETATTKFNLVCNDSTLVSTLLSLRGIGNVLLTPMLSPLSDWIGRKYSFLLVIIIYSITCVSPIIFRDFTTFVIARFISAGVLMIYYQIPFVMVMESVGPLHRTKVAVISALAYACGACMIPWIAYITGDWVWLSVVQLCITIVYIIGCIFLPESASWLVTQERYEDAHRTIKKIAKVNGKSVPYNLMVKLRKVGSKNRELKTQATDSTWDLIRVSEIRKLLIILTIIFAANTLSYDGLTLNTLNFHGNEFVNFFFLALVDMPALFIGWYFIESRLGRRWTNTISLFICAFSLFIPALLPPTQKTLMTIMSLCGKFGIASSYMIIYQQAAELFPTSLRSQGMGICTSIGAFIGILNPYITYLGRYGVWIPMLIFSFACIIASIASSFLPETLNEYLPQNTKEAKKFVNETKYFSLAKTELSASAII